MSEQTNGQMKGQASERASSLEGAIPCSRPGHCGGVRHVAWQPSLNLNRILG